jgi:hypothetical protein
MIIADSVRALVGSSNYVASEFMLGLIWLFARAATVM